MRLIRSESLRSKCLTSVDSCKMQLTSKSSSHADTAIHRSLNADTLLSLQILQDDFHPHSHNQGPTNASSGSKEGLSVYGLFHYLARTPQGKLRLRQYFLRPSLDLRVVNQRHDAISILLQASNETFLNDIIKSLKSIKNMRNVVTNLRKGVSGGSSKNQGLTSGVWFSLRSVSLKSCSFGGFKLT